MKYTTFDVPVLFLIFNRPETTRKVFDRIKLIKPAHLYVSADGCKQGRDESKCKEARDIINEIDWECTLKTNYSEANLGCKNAVSTGIDWFFENVEQGIILEDDCLPDLTFFNYCSAILEKYRTDQRVMHIGGTNFQDGVYHGEGSYYFSRLVHVWGWATWKRSWEKYDPDIKSYNNFISQNLIREIFPDKKQQDYWLRNFELVYSGKKDTWDFQWVYTIMINNGLSVIPNENLVTNLGFGADATHTTLSASPLGKRGTGNLKDITHPEFFIPCRKADDYTFNKYLAPGKVKKLYQVIKSKIKS